MSILLEARGVAKSFAGVQALRAVNLILKKGEVLAVLGENGAGKSTLMKALAGVQQVEEGEFFLEGEQVPLNSVRDALAAGIALIHQELNLADNLSVAANIFLGRERSKGGLLDDRKMEQEALPFLEMVGLEIDPTTELSQLSLGQQQLVEIAKALSIDARVLIMDEPTSSLSQSESAQLFKVVRKLVKNGVSVIYISHRLSEIVEIADRVSVLRDGENAGGLDLSEISHNAMVRLMVGRDVDQFYHRTPHEPGEIVLELKSLTTNTYPDKVVDLAVRAGEVVGMAGLVGAGRTELLETLFGIRPALAGEVLLKGRSHSIASPREAIAAGLALVPEDRKTQGALLEMSVRENASLASVARDAVGGFFLNRSAEKEISREGVDSLSIRTPGDWQLVRYLSGGNQQKVVLAKWLAMKPSILLLDEPTRGIDIGAKEELYRLIDELARNGMGILMVSSDLEEIMGLSDRVVVMHEGSITGELAREQFSEEGIMALATDTAPMKETVTT